MAPTSPKPDPQAGASSENKNPNNPPPAQASASLQVSNESGTAPTKKKRHRAGRKRRNRRQSFATQSTSERGESPAPLAERTALTDVPEHVETRSPFYRLHNRAASEESLDSEALLDHRNQEFNRQRRQSLVQVQQRRNLPPSRLAYGTAYGRSPRHDYDYGEGLDEEVTDSTPLISGSQRPITTAQRNSSFGLLHPQTQGSPRRTPVRRRTSRSSSKSRPVPHRQASSHSFNADYDVNNPPSVPGSPRLGAEEDFDDVMLPEFTANRSPETSRNIAGTWPRDAVIDIDRVTDRSRSPEQYQGVRRRDTGQSPVEDVCIPFEYATELGEDEYRQPLGQAPKPRRRRKEWPDLTVLEEWSLEEKEELQQEGVHAKKVSEPVLVGGRLRPRKGQWSREEEELPFRWTYFIEDFDSSLRSHTISGLQQLGHSFRELFIPDPPEIEPPSSDDEDDEPSEILANVSDRPTTPLNGAARAGTRQSSILDHRGFEKSSSGDRTPSKAPASPLRTKLYGPRPAFWLDVFKPTYEEMRVISRAFGLHKLTAEDIMEQEAREKIELFRNYYFVNYRTFEQDEKSENYMSPVNMYIVVFRHGVLTFHFSQMPHPANVRRRIRQLAEHQICDPDWIAYALIDNITDTYAPWIEQIEDEVDEIDAAVLNMHGSQVQESPHGDEKKTKSGSAANDEKSEAETSKPDFGRNMLLRVGECRKRVMGLYRLLGNKADVIKGLAKRCNEQWEVAPKSDVGLYLGDIQDHIVTMTSNLTHHENILSRAHSNYLAQISINMNERAEMTGDNLNKLTVLGTIVLPMNIITGMWGMNCLVPGQDVDNLWWFFGITTFLFAFGFSCYYIAQRVYRIM